MTDALSTAQTQSIASSAWLTTHAAIRMQQRGIDIRAIQCLVQYGRRQYDHHQAEVVIFDEASLAAVAAKESLAMWKLCSSATCLYAVINADGQVVTAGHRYRRIRRDVSISSYRQGRSRSPRVINRTCR